MSRAISLLIAAIVAVAFSCSPTRNAGTPVMFTDIPEANSFRIPSSGNAVIRDSAVWRNLWNSYWNAYDSSGAKTPPPAIDFDRYMVIGVFWGEGYTGCSNHVDAIFHIGALAGHIEVWVKTLPDPGNCQLQVYPLQMVTVEKTDLPVRFRSFALNNFGEKYQGIRK